MLGSLVFYAGLALLVTGALSLLRPLRFLAIRTRTIAACVFGGGAAMAAGALLWPSPAVCAATQADRIDEFMPRWQFDERHTIHIAASPDRVFAAIHAVSADEILLFRTLTSIRRFGRPGPESILNAPSKRPLLEVVTRTGFLLLADDPPRELVLGAVLAAPAEARRGGRVTPELFKRPLMSGVVLTTMNFVAIPDGRGGSTVSTETRVYANDERSLRKFAIYWRVIHPGSDIIRRMWLRAIRKRAEREAA